LTPTSGPSSLRLICRLGGNSCRPSLSHTLDPHHKSQHAFATLLHHYHYHHHHHHNLGQYTGPREFGLREGFKSHHITRHIRSGGCTIIHNFDTIQRTDTTASSTLRVSSVHAYLLHCLHFFGQRSEGTTAAEQKSLACQIAHAGSVFPSFLLQNTPYALFFLPSSLALFFIIRVLVPVLLAWSVGLRRAPVFERARPRRLAMRWKGYMGQFRSGGNYTLASLS
jgi:hypothetical protein